MPNDNERNMTDTRYAIARKLHHAEGDLAYLLDVFGDHVASKHGYKGMDGMDAIHFYLIQKHHWLPRDVRSMSPADIRFALRQ